MDRVEEKIKHDKPIYHAEYNSEGIINFEELFKYDEKGRIIDHKTIYVDESSICKKYKYDKFDNPIYKYEYSNLDNEELWYKIYAAYNKDNKPIYIISVANNHETFEDVIDEYNITDSETSNGTYQNITLFKYDNLGRLIAIRNNSKDYPDTNYVYNGESDKNYTETKGDYISMISEDGKNKKVYKNYVLISESRFDDHCNCIYEKFDFSEYIKEYNENNLLLKSISKYFLSDDKNPYTIINKYKYDENNNCIYEEFTDSESDKVQWIKYKYDKSNNLIISETSVGTTDYYTYNYKNQLITIERIENEKTIQLFSADYDEKGRLIVCKHFQTETIDHYKYED